MGDGVVVVEGVEKEVVKGDSLFPFPVPNSLGSSRYTPLGTPS